uniref:Uncharacterized protein n=1 Tax=Arundo donax TaxID=35708 RepID=A0A0A9DC51_ARUDO
MRTTATSPPPTTSMPTFTSGSRRPSSRGLCKRRPVRTPAMLRRRFAMRCTSEQGRSLSPRTTRRPSSSVSSTVTTARRTRRWAASDGVTWRSTSSSGAARAPPTAWLCCSG